MLRCSVCNEKMIYCHGDFKVPYFRHEKNCDCPDIYSEGVTQEHLKGIQVIYEWLKIQENILNLQLEKWIPETKQRPDIYFELKENDEVKKYAIEFQCSPIATKYNDRHDLYRLNNINDIWILGFDKYDIKNYRSMLLKYNINNQILENIKTKTIEREIKNSDKSLIYLTNSKIIKITDELIETYDSNYNERKTIFDFNIDSKAITDCEYKNLIDNNSLYLSDNTLLKEKINIIQSYTNKLNETIIGNEYKYSIFIYGSNVELKIIRNSHNRIYNQVLELFSEEYLYKCYNNEIENYKMKINLHKDLEKACESLTNRFSIVNKDCEFDLISSNNSYLFRIEFDSSVFKRTFYIKEKSTDCTKEDSFTQPFRGKRGGTGWRRVYYDKTIDKLEYDAIDSNKIVDYISNTISNTLRDIKYRK